jgi:hypothetical protein
MTAVKLLICAAVHYLAAEACLSLRREEWQCIISWIEEGECCYNLHQLVITVVFGHATA